MCNGGHGQIICLCALKLNFQKDQTDLDTALVIVIMLGKGMNIELLILVKYVFNYICVICKLYTWQTFNDMHMNTH